MRRHVGEKGGQLKLQPRVASGDEIVVHILSGLRADMTADAQFRTISRLGQRIHPELGVSLLSLCFVEVSPGSMRAEPIASSPVARLAADAGLALCAGHTRILGGELRIGVARQAARVFVSR